MLASVKPQRIHCDLHGRLGQCGLLNSMEKSDYTKILNEASLGSSSAAATLFDEIYRELKMMARRQVVGERGDVQATMLVHEVFLKLFGDDVSDWNNRAHFFGTAAEAMRRVLVDLARVRKAQKRGGDRLQVTLSDSSLYNKSSESPDELLDLNQAIGKLEAEDEVLARIVKLRFFAGQNMEAIAELLDTSLSSVERKWRLARAFLVDQVSG